MSAGSLGRAQVDIDLDLTPLTGQVEQVHGLLAGLADTTTELKLAANTEAAMTGLQQVTAEVEQVTHVEPVITVAANTESAQRSLSGVEAIMAQVSGAQAIVKAVAETDAAMAELQKIQSELATLSSTPARVQVQADVSEALAQLSDLQTQLGRVQSASSEGGGILSGLTTAGEAAGGMLAGIGEKAAGVATGMLGANLAMNAVSGAFNFVKDSAIGLNASLETSTLQFTTLMGNADQARQHVRDLFEFAAVTPFETGPVIEASRYMELFGHAALDTNENLKRVGDTAATAGQDIGEVGFWVARVYADIQGGQPFGMAALSLEKMGALSLSAAQKMEALQKSGADSATVWKVFTDYMDQNNGAMERQAKTWTGLTSTLHDFLGITAANVLAPFFEQAKEAMSNFLTYTGTADFQAKIDGWTKSAGEFATKIHDFVVNDGPQVVQVSQDLATNLLSVATSIGQITLAINNAKGAYDQFRAVIPTAPGGSASYAIGAPGIGQVSQGINLASGVVNAVLSGQNNAAIQQALKTQEQYNSAYQNFIQLHTYDEQYIGNYTKLTLDAASAAREERDDRAALVGVAGQQQAAATGVANAIQQQIDAVHRLIAADDEYKRQQGNAAKEQRSYTDASAPLETPSEAAAPSNVAALQPMIDFLKQAGPAGLGTVFKAVESGAVDATQAVNTFVQSGTVDFKQFQEAGTTEVKRLQQTLADAFSRGDLAGARALQAQIDLITATMQHAAAVAPLYTTALQKVQDAAGGLAHTQDLLTGVMNTFSSQASGYNASATALTNARDAINAKVKQGIPITQTEQDLLNNYPQLYGRMEGGVRDATISEGVAAEAKGKLMLAQDNLNDAVKHGEQNLAPYQQAVSDAQKALNDADPNSAFKQALDSLNTTIGTDLKKSIDDLAKAIDELNGKSAHPDIGVDTKQAKTDIGGVQGDLDTFASGEYRAAMKAQDDATPTVLGVKANFENFSSGEYTAALRARDDASAIAKTATDNVSAFASGEYRVKLSADATAAKEAISSLSGQVGGLVAGGRGSLGPGLTEFGPGESVSGGGYSIPISANTAAASGPITDLQGRVSTLVNQVYTATVGADTADGVQHVGELSTEIYSLPTTFTVTAVVDTSAALAAISDLDAHMPHSPAKTGPFSVLPNWHALFDIAPAAMQGILTVATAGQQITDSVQGVATDMGAAGAKGAADFVSPIYKIPSDVQDIFDSAPALDLSWLTKGVDQSSKDAAKQMTDNIVQWLEGLNLDDIASGAAQKKLQDDLDNLFRIRQIAIEDGAPQAAIDKIDSDIQSKQAELTAVGQVAGTAVMKGFTSELNAKAAFDTFIGNVKTALGGIGQLDLSHTVTLKDFLGNIPDQIRELHVLHDAAAAVGADSVAADYQKQLDDLGQQEAILVRLFGTDGVQAFIKYKQAEQDASDAAQRHAQVLADMTKQGSDFATAFAQGGDAFAHFITQSMTGFDQAKAALDLGKQLGLSPAVIKQLQDNFDAAQRIYNQGLGTLRVMLEHGLITPQTLASLAQQGGAAFTTWYDAIFGKGALAAKLKAGLSSDDLKALYKAGGDAFAAWYDGMFGAGSFEQVKKGWATLIDPSTVASLFADPIKVTQDSVTALVTAIQNGALSANAALTLMGGGTTNLVDSQKVMLDNYLHDTWTKYQQAVLDGNDAQAASYKATYDAIMAILQAFATAHHLTIDQVIGDWDKLKKAADDAASASKTTDNGLPSAASSVAFNTPVYDSQGHVIGYSSGTPGQGQQQQAQMPGFDTLLSAIVGFNTDTSMLTDEIKTMVAHGDLNNTKLDEQMSLLQQVYAHPELFPAAMLDHIRDGLKDGLDKAGIGSKLNEAYINQQLTSAGLKPLSDAEFAKWGQSWQDQLINVSQKQVDAIIKSGSDIVAAINAAHGISNGPSNSYASLSDAFAAMLAASARGGKAPIQNTTNVYLDSQPIAHAVSTHVMTSAAAM